MRDDGAGRGERLIQLEAARGLASVVVLFHHLALAFLPRAKGPLAAGGLMRSPVAFLLNGGAAVTLFFVLSGFVLTRRFFERGVAPGELATAAAKRLPRLALPAGASLLLGWLVLADGLTAHVAAGRLANSGWLAEFAGGGLPAAAAPSLADAAWQALAVFFQPLGGQRLYNGNLWTMHPEFVGSLFCFAAVGLLDALRRDRPRAAVLLAMACALLGIVLGPLLLPFLAGMLIARLHPREARLRGALPATLLVGGGLLGLCGDDLAPQLVGAALLLVALLACPGPRAALATRWGVALGRLSFPLYLVHPALICTAGSFLYLDLAAAGVPRWAMAVTTIAATALASVVAALPFVRLDEWWTARVNAAARALAAPRATVGAPLHAAPR